MVESLIEVSTSREPIELFTKINLVESPIGVSTSIALGSENLINHRLMAQLNAI